MAQAACIAEGTIFRVFPDKPTLIFEAIKASFDPQPVIDRLATIERALPLDIKLRKAAAIILERSLRVHALVARPQVDAIVRSLQPRGRPPECDRGQQPDPP